VGQAYGPHYNNSVFDQLFCINCRVINRISDIKVTVNLVVVAIGFSLFESLNFGIHGIKNNSLLFYQMLNSQFYILLTQKTEENNLEVF
jgi:hypothetical protein